ncbi:MULTISPECIES: histidine kinase [unclassified Spirosoma]|uniref:sensor histidine kinase n=1 Tax=unclassified Spirosoma TaxID=2621999 RepID=UPI00095F1912|nr:MULTISPECIES: histidine kinase [unclassified Spirosoma]MBN8825930.1 histidine kinase [Spirosoma sp.]OJW70968.1 MAG: histidine kinase [Spirosoma sp. 48-14]
MQPLSDKWMRILGVPLLALVGQWAMYGYTNVPYPDDWRIPFFFVLGSVVVWESNRWGIIFSRRRYPEQTQTWQRVLYQLSWFIVFASFIRITQTWFYQQIGLWHSTELFEFKPYFFNTLVSVVGTVQIAAVYEGIYLYQRWRITYEEAEELKKVNLQSQLDSLKTQINPHFLFNNLNSLSSLITTDAQQAELFLDELSSVYRYLLRQDERSLCPLAEEIRFIKSYFYLLKTRFGDGIFMEIAVDEYTMLCLIPPLTLQLLFENAIRHNIISVDRPLTIRVYTEQKILYVENNRQLRTATAASNQTGLQNSMTKYKLLDQPSVTVYQDESRFRVGVPLLPPPGEVTVSKSERSR